MQLVLTELSGWTLPIPGPNGEPYDVPSRERATKLGLHEGLPILLHDDGTYDEELNAWMRSLPGNGCTSPHTWKAYARDVITWIHYFAHLKPGVSWKYATREDLTRFRTARTETSEDSPRDAISASSWNRAVTAMESLYTWAAEEGLIAKTPFQHRVRIAPSSRDAGGQAVKSNTLRDAHYTEEKRTQYVRPAQYRTFREVGLRWLDDHGIEDPRTHAGRQAHRNVVLADFLYLSGLRIQEGASILEWEVPSAEALRSARAGVALEWTVAKAIAKGGKRRVIRVAQRALRQLRDYADLERRNLIESHRRDDGTYSGIKHPIVVRRVDDGHYRILATGTVRSIDNTGPATRARLVERLPDGSQRPVALWLGERGAPLRVTSWEDVFEKAEERSGIYVRPHMLRHTYAVNLLAQLVEGTIKAAVKKEDDTTFQRIAHRLYAEPLNLVRRQLGHASITQTYQYLDCLEDAQSFVDDAVACLDDGAVLTDIPWQAIRVHD